LGETRKRKGVGAYFTSNDGLTTQVQGKIKEDLIYKQGKGTPQGGVISPLLANAVSTLMHGQMV